jgi:hypothetical protein
MLRFSKSNEMNSPSLKQAFLKKMSTFIKGLRKNAGSREIVSGSQVP